MRRLDPTILLRHLPREIRRPGRGARWLLAGLTLASLLAAWSPPAALPWLLIGPTTLPELRVTALVTDGLISPPTGLFGLVLFLGLALLLNLQAVRQLWHVDPLAVLRPVGILLGVGVLAQLVLMPGLGAAWLVDAALFTWLLAPLEARWGGRRTLAFLGILLAAGALTCALVLWIAPSTYGPLLGAGGAQASASGLPNGTRALLHTLFATWGLHLGRQRLGATPVTGRHILLFVLILAAFDLVFVGVAAGARTLVSVLLARALVEGTGHPRHALDRLRLAWLQARQALRRRRLRVVRKERR
jgi:hypothetical protein